MIDWPGTLWVFGYGSLMWDPRFPFVEAQPARLFGYHRALCVLSIRNRGTEDRPGLALGIDRGGSCTGRAFRVAAENANAALTHLEERELSTGIYEPRRIRVHLGDGRRPPALVFVTCRDHPQYAGDLSPAEAARLVRQGCGAYGSSMDYLRNVVLHLDEIGIEDGPLHRILAQAEASPF
jgi:cation transport protein ChaC